MFSIKMAAFFEASHQSGNHAQRFPRHDKFFSVTEKGRHSTEETGAFLCLGFLLNPSQSGVLTKPQVLLVILHGV